MKLSNGLIESTTRFSFHLDGDSEIDTFLLTDTIQNMAELTKIAVTEENPEAYLKMNVTALKNGSFEICFSAVCTYAEEILTFAATTAPLALTAVETVKGFFEIKKFLKGEQPKSVTENEDKTIRIEKSNAETITVNAASGNIINGNNNVTIDNCIVNIFHNAAEHNPSGGCSFSNEKGTTYYSNDDVKHMKKPFVQEQEVTISRVKAKAVDLSIKKPDLIGQSQWGFRYKNKNIDAKITDDTFLEQVHKGIPIKRGDYITATLQIDTEMDLFGHPIAGSEKYEIIEVIGGIKHCLENSENNEFNFGE